MGKMIRGRFLVILLLGLGILLAGSSQAKAQSADVVENVRVGHDFGEEIRFTITVNSSDPVEEVLVLFRDVREDNTRVYPMAETEGEYFYRYDASANLLNPFAQLSISFQVRLSDGTEFTSQKFSYIYSDNRFTWEMREDGNLRVHWTQGDETFGQAALDAARNGFERISQFFPANGEEMIDIYIYASPADLQNALFMGGQSWVAGHADPALGLVFVAVAPGSQERILMQQQIPHELAHVLLYRYVGEGYQRLPNWLLEGIAALAELYPNPDHALALERAVSQHTLIPLNDLCGPFPRDASQAFLSYAESASFTRFLRETGGSTRLDALIRAYADGLSCEAGAVQVYGQTLDNLDVRWQEETLGANMLNLFLRKSAPYLILMAIFVIYPLFQFFTPNPDREQNDR